MSKARKPPNQPADASVQTGDGGVGIGGDVNQSIVITGDGNTVIQPAPPLPETHDTIGNIPPYKAVTYVHRGKIEDDVIAFLKNGGTGAIVGLHAPGGLGKTELAKHAWEAVRERFEDILWIDVSENSAQEVVRDMLLKCNVQARPAADYAEQRNELQAYLKTRRLLVVLDDVRQNALENLDDILPPKPCACLVTSRIQQIGGVGKTFELDHMTEGQARELMEAVLSGEVVAAETESAQRLAERCKFNSHIIWRRRRNASTN